MRRAFAEKGNLVGNGPVQAVMPSRPRRKRISPVTPSGRGWTWTCLESACARVRASNVPVVALEDHPGDTEEAVRAEAEAAWREDDIDAVVLGCASMARLAIALQDAIPIPVVHPVTAAIGAMTWLLK